MKLNPVLPRAWKNCSRTRRPRPTSSTQTSEQLAARDKTLETAKKRLIDAKYLDANAGNEDVAKGLDQALNQGQSPLLSAVSTSSALLVRVAQALQERIGQVINQSTHWPRSKPTSQECV